MIVHGKIIEYDGSSGFIKDTEGNTYILAKHNILYKNPKVGDYVSFIPEVYKTVEIEEKIAVFVQLIK